MITTYFKQLVAEKLLGVSGSSTLPSTLYLGLSKTSSAPTAAGGNVSEPSGNGYSRVSLSGKLSFNSSTGVVSNSATGATITFGEATGSWGTVYHYVVYDASSGGHLLISGPLASSKSIVVGDIPRVAQGALQINITDT